MNTIRKSILIGLTVLGMGTASLAVQAEEAAHGRHGQKASMEQMHERMAGQFAKRQARLHDLLKLTPAQESAWTTYQAAIKPEPAANHPDHAAMKALSAPERMSKMIEFSKQHTSKMEAHLSALNAFYGTLTAEQKKVFDDNVMGGARAPHQMMMMRHHG